MAEDVSFFCCAEEDDCGPLVMPESSSVRVLVADVHSGSLSLESLDDP